MASSISRFVLRPSGCRLYSAQAARKVENLETKITKVNGVSVGTLPNYSPVCRVTVAVKAGSRHEDESNLGVSHCLRHAVQLKNQNNLSFEIIKQLQYMAGRFNVNTTRDATYYSVECLPNQIEDSLNVLSPIIARSKVDQYNFAEFGGFEQQMGRDIAMLKLQPNVEVTELLHSAAYRGSLANSLYAQPQFLGTYTPEMLMAFTNNNYQASRMSVAAMGTDEGVLSGFVNGLKFSSGGVTNDRKAKYVGGERRENRPSSGLTYAAIATEAPGLSNKDLIPAVILEELMDMGDSLKYGSDRSRLSQVVAKATTGPFQVSSLGAYYADSGLFGFVLGAPAGEMDKALKAAVAEFASVTKKGFTDAEVQVAKVQAKLRFSQLCERSEVQLTSLCDSMLGQPNATTTEQVNGLIDAVKTADINTVANKIINGKTSMSAVGNLSTTPFMDELFN